MRKKHPCQTIIRVAVCFCLCLSSIAAHAAAGQTASSAIAVARWTCNAFYLPARNIWQRTVDVEFIGNDVRAVQIDGVPVYAFNIQGTTVLTAVDGERIQFDPVAQSWASDWRGVISSLGRCNN